MNDKMIAKLESKGFKRWTKETSRGTLDRLYLNATACGLEVDYYKTGNVSSAHFEGERISNSEGRRMLSQKTYIDLNDDSIHSDYWNDTFRDIAQTMIDEAAAEVEAEEKAETEQAAEEVEVTAEIEAEDEKKLWYAVLNDEEDSDWGTGFYEFELARKLMIEKLDRYPDAHIAVIDEGDGSLISKVCIDEIRPEDLDEPYDIAARIVKAHDWDACKDDLDELMEIVGLKEEWELADGDNFENIIIKAGARIGISFI